MDNISSIAAPDVGSVELFKPRFLRLPSSVSFSRFFGSIGDAHRMALVDPYTSPRLQPRILTDDALEGRDPTW